MINCNSLKLFCNCPFWCFEFSKEICEENCPCCAICFCCPCYFYEDNKREDNKRNKTEEEKKTKEEQPKETEKMIK